MSRWNRGFSWSRPTCGTPRQFAAMLMASLVFLGFLSTTVEAALRFAVVWYSSAPDEETYDLAARRYDVGVTGLLSGQDRLAVLQRNPSFHWFVYNSGTDNYVPPHKGGTEEHEALQALAMEKHWNIEDAYLHYLDDTVIVLRGDTLSLPGWSSKRPGSKEASRVPVYYSDLTRRANHFGTPRSRQLQIELNIKTRLDKPFPGTSRYAWGLFLDNASGHLFNTGKVLSGGHVREAPKQVSITTEEFRAWYLNTFLEFLSSLKDTLETSATWSRDGQRKELMINIANMWHDEYVDRDVADILMMEFQYNAIRNVGSKAVMDAYRRDAYAARNGIVCFYSAGMTKSVQGYPEAYSREDVMMGNLSWYLMTRSEKTLFYQLGTNASATAGWDSLTWIGSMDVARTQLGEAKSPPYTLTEGTDPLGQPYVVYARHYQNGLVLLRNRGSWKERIGSDTVISVKLPTPMARVWPSGKVSTVVQGIELRNGEGALFLGDPGRDPTSDKKRNRSP